MKTEPKINLFAKEKGQSWSESWQKKKELKVETASFCVYFTKIIS
jgi:hypothetical protein